MDIKVPQLLKTKILVLLIMLFSILIRIPYFDCPLCADESGFAYQAHFWLKGVSFYESCFFDYPPGFPLIYAFIFKTLDDKISTLRLFLAVWNAITVFFIYLTAQELFDRPTALFSAFLYGCFSWSPLIKGNVAKDMFMPLPLIISLYFYVRYHKSLELSSLCLIGVFCGIAGIFKQSVLPLWGFFLIFICLRSLNRIRDIVFFIFSGCLPIILCFIYCDGFLDVKNFYHIIIANRVFTASIFVGTWWYHLLRGSCSLIKSGLLFWVIALILGMKFIRKDFTFYLLTFHLFFSFLGVALPGYWYDHYYALLLPSLCILLGWECVKIWQFKNKAFILANIILITIPYVAYIMVSLHFNNFCLRTYHEYLLTPKIANYLSRNCNKAHTFYAFLYTDPNLYLLLKKRSPFPYMFRTQFLYWPKCITEFIGFINSLERPDYLITYPKQKTIQIIRHSCEPKSGIINKVQQCVCTTFRPFCQGYPIQISLIKDVFTSINKYYVAMKSISIDETSVIIWKNKSLQKNQQ